MDDLAQNWNRLFLLEREGPGCNLTKDDGVPEFSIAAKFFTKRALSIDVIARTFTPMWRSRNGFKIKSRAIIKSFLLLMIRMMLTKSL